LNILLIAKRALRFGRPSGSFASRNLTHAATVDGRSPNVDDRVESSKIRDRGVRVYAANSAIRPAAKVIYVNFSTLADFTTRDFAWRVANLSALSRSVNTLADCPLSEYVTVTRKWSCLRFGPRLLRRRVGFMPEEYHPSGRSIPVKDVDSFREECRRRRLM